MNPQPWVPLFKKLDASLRRSSCKTVFDPGTRTAKVAMAGRALELMICPKSRYGDGPFYKKTPHLVVCVASKHGLAPADAEHLAAYLAGLEKVEAELSRCLEDVSPESAAKPGEGVQPLIQDLTLRQAERVVGKLCLLSLTMRCNQACLFCPVLRDVPVLPEAKIMSELAAYCRANKALLPATSFLITGGEPTLSPALEPAVRLLAKEGAGSCTLLSNAVRFAEPGFLDAIWGSGIRKLFLSFHSHQEKTYDLLTGTKGLFPKASRGIKEVLKRPFFEVTCNVVLTKRNYKDLPGLAALLAGLAGSKAKTKTLNLCISAMNENPAWDELCVPHAKTAVYLRKTLKEGKVPMTAFMGDCAMPVCVGSLYKASAAIVPSARVDTAAWYAPAGWAPDSSPVPTGFLRVKSEACRKCRFDPVCGGLASRYARRFGVSELRSVKG
ncbi:MAG: radical SAM protein [Elusimicrobia bacterium]|nr:radical SAM protein [Elusimicrobiota bacterium]